LPSSLPSPFAPLERAVDGDPLTFWASTLPSEEPPKDIGIEWDTPPTVGCLVVRFYSVGYRPAPDGWRVETRVDGTWQPVEATVDHPECEWWTIRFAPTSCTAVRLVVTKYAKGRPSICELEAYANGPPQPQYRRLPLLDGAFWACEYEGWAKHFATDADLARQAEAAHAAGLDTILLYTTTGQDGVCSTSMPDAVLPQSPWWRGRDPVEAVLAAADRLGMTVYLTDTQPNGFNRPAPADVPAEVETKLYEHRRRYLERFAAHPSLVGYYLNFECCPADFGNDPSYPAAQAEKLAAFVEQVVPRLQVVQPVGLYHWRETPDGTWRHVAPAELRPWWGTFMAAAPSVDAYLVIDGVGTGLAPLNHTDLAQACLRELCDRYGKAMWTDVEDADFGDYTSMPIGRLIPSIEVAARHAERIVTFDYINYLCPGNGREGSQRLFDDYQAYRQAALDAKM
jgi:hypothetical protein